MFENHERGALLASVGEDTSTLITQRPHGCAQIERRQLLRTGEITVRKKKGLLDEGKEKKHKSRKMKKDFGFWVVAPICLVCHRQCPTQLLGDVTMNVHFLSLVIDSKSLEGQSTSP